MITDVNIIEGNYLNSDTISRVSRSQMKKKKKAIRFENAILKCVLALIIELLFIIIFYQWLSGSIPAEYEGEYTTYIVSKGDRLWDIAESVSDNKDIREVIHIIKNDNRLDNANLYIGQELKIRCEY